MARTTYQERLEELRMAVVEMADLTLDRYDQAIEVLETGDAPLAEHVIVGDEAINELYLDLESDCIELIALQQPVASDLRFIASSFKIVTDLERVGDLATNLAAYGRDAGGAPISGVDPEPLGVSAGEMVHDAMAAYRQDDATIAREVAARDDDLDEQCKATSEDVVRDLLSVERGTTDVESTLADVSRALLTIRDLERVGDHAVNICARTVYMVENDDELIY